MRVVLHDISSGRTLLGQKPLFRVGLGVLQTSLNRSNNAEEVADVIHLAAALLNTVHSIDSLPSEVTGSRGSRRGFDDAVEEAATDDEEAPLAMEAFLREGGAPVMEKCLALAAKYRNNCSMHSDIVHLYQETGRVLAAQRFCEHATFNSSAARRFAMDAAKLYQAFVKNVTMTVKKCALPKGGVDAFGVGLGPDVATLSFMESLARSLSAGSRARGACMGIAPATEKVLDAVKAMAASRKTAGVVCHLLCALEKITQHEAEHHKTLSTLAANVTQDRTKVFLAILKRKLK